MLRYAADEGFDKRIVTGLRQRSSAIDIVTVQEQGIRGAPDSEVLEWAADEGRVLLTNDMRMMGGAARSRVAAGLATPGVFIVHAHSPMGQVIDTLELLAGASLDDEWEGQMRYLPLL